MILPIVKKQTELGGTCTVPSSLTYRTVGELGRMGGHAFSLFVAGAKAIENDAFVTFALDETLDARDEIYRVTVHPDRITVGFRDARGAVNGAATVALLLCKHTVPTCEIVDYPDFGYRSFLLDFSRGVPTREHIFSTLRSMALAKYNRVHLHLIDSFGPCYISDALPEYQFAEKGEPCQKSLLLEIADYCRCLALEIVPELEIPAHACAVTRAHPEFLCVTDDPIGWALCPGNDDVWDFYDKLTGELVELFPDCRYIHIGTDELEFQDITPPRLCYWDTCPRCAALRKREVLADLRAEFYYLVDRMHEIVKSHGKKMMMWNDQIDIAKPVPISREILIHFWRIAAPGRGPFENCTMEAFLEQGFTLVNSFYPYTYTDRNHYISPEKMKTWTPFRTPLGNDVHSDRILGGEGCAWMMGDYTEYSFLGYVMPPVIAILGDKLWDGSERSHTEEYRAALSEFLFGSDALTCIFDCVGDLLPPRRNHMFVAPDAPIPTKETVASCLAVLSTVQNKNYRFHVREYTRLLNNIMEQVTKV